MCTQALETLQLLIELSYGGLYTRKAFGDEPFDFHTLINLIIVANMFLFTDCIKECSDELVQCLTSPAKALTVIGSLAHYQGVHPSIDTLLDAAVPVVGILEDLLSHGTPCSRPDLAVQQAIKINMEVKKQS